MERLNNPQWYQEANCATTDPEIMVPEKGGGGGKLARKICAECVVVADCLTSALNEGDLYHGFRGAMSPRERQAEARLRGMEVDEDERLAG